MCYYVDAIVFYKFHISYSNLRAKLRNIFREDKNRVYTRRMEVPMYFLYKFTRAFFGSLVFKGGKIRAFNWFLTLKMNIRI